MFIAAEKLRLPYMSAYLDSIGTDFRHGANFATGGSSIRLGGYSPFHLGIQMLQFLQFKSRTTALFHKLPPNSESSWLSLLLSYFQFLMTVLGLIMDHVDMILNIVKDQSNLCKISDTKPIMGCLCLPQIGFAGLFCSNLHSGMSNTVDFPGIRKKNITLVHLGFLDKLGFVIGQIYPHETCFIAEH